MRIAISTRSVIDSPHRGVYFSTRKKGLTFLKFFACFFLSSVEQRELRQCLFKEGSVAFGANTVVAGRRELVCVGDSNDVG